MPIRILNATLIDQIAAGEVIERPASVIKELIENALDAGARRIDIELERAGIGLIRVRDDGSGISLEDLTLAIERHATSKIATLDDLEGIASFGFRGEALPSIGAVARLRLISRRADAEHAHELQVEGGERSSARPAAHPAGTSVEVRDLFYNVPARRKFVRAEPTEFAHILRQIERLALSAPAVAFRVSHNGRGVLDLPAGTDAVGQRRRVTDILGEDFLAQALPIEVQEGPWALRGWLGLPTASRAQPDRQYWYVNARAVRDRLLGSAVRLGYRDVLYHGRHPSYLLYLSLDPRQVDVNAHPTKLELRFRDGRAVHDRVFRLVEQVLSATRPSHENPEATRPLMPDVPTQLPAPLHTGSAGGSMLDASAWSVPRWSPGHSAAVSGAYARSAQAAAQLLSQPGLASDPLPLGVAIAQLHGLYILAQSRDGLIVVDTHAAHERVLYEQLKAQFDAATPAAQGLLEPIVVSAAEHQLDALLAQSADLARVGFELQRLSPGSLAVRQVPVILGRTDVSALLQQLARELTGDSELTSVHHLDGAAHRILGNIACRAAIRGQRALSLAEMDALLRQMEHTERASQCNHGRPAWMRLSLREIDQLFLRGR